MRLIPLALLAALLMPLPGDEVRAGANDWSLMDIAGETFSLAHSAGDSPVLLLFWATWCVPCRKELDDNRALLDSYARKGVTVLLVSEDTQKTQARVKPFIESKGYTWRALLDPHGDVLKRYGGTSLPYSVLLDRNGVPVQKIRGALRDPAGLTAKIDNLLQAAGE